MENLEQPEATKESTEQESGAEVSEVAEKVSESAEDVSGEQEKTFKQEDVDKLVAEKEKEWQSRKDTEFSTLQEEVGNLRKQASIANLATQEHREIEAWGDTPEVRAFQEERRKHTEQWDALVTRTERAETYANKANMSTRFYAAREIASAHPGLDVDDLLRCKTPDEMQDMVKLYDKLKSNLQEEGKETQKLDSSVPSASGVNLGDKSPGELIKFALDQNK